MPVGAEVYDELGNQPEGVVEGSKLGELAADMRVDADDSDARQYSRRVRRPRARG